tara:strand:+ start:204 stop:401 length:198 start_codon:yes stop_codon:yes gene_type:complete
MKEKQKLVRFRVYDRNGRYHQSYINEVDAEACAKHVGGTKRSVAKEDATNEWVNSLDKILIRPVA